MPGGAHGHRHGLPADPDLQWLLHRQQVRAGIRGGPLIRAGRDCPPAAPGVVLSSRSLTRLPRRGTHI